MREHLKTVISWNSREKSFLKGEVQGVKKVKCCVESLGTGVTLPFKLRGYPKEHSTKLGCMRAGIMSTLPTVGQHSAWSKKVPSKYLVNEGSHVS